MSHLTYLLLGAGAGELAALVAGGDAPRGEPSEHADRRVRSTDGAVLGPHATGGRGEPRSSCDAATLGGAAPAAASAAPGHVQALGAYAGGDAVVGSLPHPQVKLRFADVEFGVAAAQRYQLLRVLEEKGCLEEARDSLRSKLTVANRKLDSERKARNDELQREREVAEERGREKAERAADGVLRNAESRHESYRRRSLSGPPSSGRLRVSASR